MYSGWPADWNEWHALLFLFVHALGSPNLSVNCFDLICLYLRICCTKNDFWIAALSKHWLNLFRYSMSIFSVYSYPCAIALDKPGLCSKLMLFYLSGGIVLCRHIKHPHESAWMSLIKSLTLIKQRMCTHRVLSQNSSSLGSFSSPCPCSFPLCMLLLHDLLQAEHQVQAVDNFHFPATLSQQKKEQRYFELCLRYNLYPWLVQLNGVSKGIIKLTVKHSRKANIQQWAVQSKLLRSIECSGPYSSILYTLCDHWAEWEMKAI